MRSLFSRSMLVLSLLAVALQAGCGGGSVTAAGGDAHIVLDGTGLPPDSSLKDADVGPADGLYDLTPPDIDAVYDIGGCDAEPFGFSCPCANNAQCASGYCVSSSFGFVCTDVCLEECPVEGWECKGMSGFGPDPIFLCMPEEKTVCVPCTDDSGCPGGVCVGIGDGTFCTFGCVERGLCPAGYSCQGEGEAAVCLPLSGACDCTNANAGALRQCTVENPFGSCAGTEKCDPKSGWVGCTAPTPVAEECDGLDNDCNGNIDDGLPQAKECTATAEGLGTCVGVATCVGALGWSCSAPLPAAETCDFLDNDCDGTADEDFMTDGKYVHPNHCGTCNHDCTGLIPNATSTCGGSESIPLCVVQDCAEGYYQWNDYQCLPEGQVLCKPCTGDIDCKGGKCVDLLGAKHCSWPCPASACPDTFECNAVEGLAGTWCVPVSGACDCFADLEGTLKPCVSGGDLGTCGGTQVCDPLLGWSDCSAAAPSLEVCDGLDNDCDGVPDDGLAGGDACTVETPGVGTCSGTLACMGAAGWVCLAATPSLETCDYKDNDCDGTADEDFVTEGKYATLHHCGACYKDCEGSIPHAKATCDATDAVPVCKVESCDEGYVQVSDYLCQPPGATTCKPCTSDADCFLDRCAPLEGGLFCFTPCDEAACANGFTCTALEGYGSVCIPTSGSCLCSQTTAGAKQACVVENPWGACFGFRVCDPASGWSECDAAEAAPEVCDGQDNDCDGLSDEDLPLSMPCESTSPAGVCAGFAVCLGAQGWQCMAPTPAEETCDYVDNDCDGAVDEGFKTAGKYAGLENCGVCGSSCVGAIPNATEACDASFLVPKCVVESCDDGYFKASATECILPPDTSCVACKSDADCLGGACLDLDGDLRCAKACVTETECAPDFSCAALGDTGLFCLPKNGTCDCSAATAGAKKACSTVNETGTCFGFRTCDPIAGWSACDALAAKAEECNGLDDDCNGSVDDGLPPFKDCTVSNPDGSCNGIAVCVGTLGWVCQATGASVEVCDGLDNDCDGKVDETFQDAGGKYVAFEHCGNCTTSCAAGFPNATAMCDAAKPVPQCVVKECDPGYFKLNELQCVSNIADLCQPCTVDTDCALEGSKCIASAGGSFCGKPCAGEPDCPDGYDCKMAAGALQCQPAGGSCQCTPTTLGFARGCKATWPVGSPDETADSVCLGSETCTAQGWGPCILPQEACDGIDNDCDGQVDEGFLVGGKYASDAHCGSCGNDCTKLMYPGAVGTCDATQDPPGCVAVCADGTVDANGDPLDGCECSILPGVDEPDGEDQNCDGIDGEVDNAVFVSPLGSDDAAGTIDDPLATVEAGIALAAASGLRDVYVATGSYEGPLVLVPGARIFGGFSLDFSLHSPGTLETRLVAAQVTAEAPGTLTAVGITQDAEPVLVDGFVVQGPVASDPGTSSYALYVRDCDDAVTFRFNRFVGGTAGNGAPGPNGTAGATGADGLPGVSSLDSGSYACAAVGPVTPGGVGGAQSCGGTDVSGGAGGSGFCPAYEAAPAVEEAGKDGGGPAGGTGGSGGFDGKVHHASCKMCTLPAADEPVIGGNGSDGANGGNGGAGTGCSKGGSVEGGLWVPGAGSAGGAGSPGSGGGGGGAGGGGDSDTSKCSDLVGGTGGGGGSGGCSGLGGSPGGGAGGSFAGFITFTAPPASLPVIESNQFEGGTGGNGGQGGAGGIAGPGGKGAIGGPGGAGEAWCAFAGGTGGDGGSGGHGGGGGGGCGGVSYALYVAGLSGLSPAQYKTAQNAFIPGAAGLGGLGGTSFGASGQPGLNGVAGATNF